MGDENTLPLKYDFLHHRDAPELFGTLDFQLKDGMHFQQITKQQAYYNFIQENQESLATYYLDFFELELTSGGEGLDSYYHLDFNGSNRGSVDAEHREFMKNEFVIVGFLLYKIIYIDKNLELSSVKALQNMIRKDYEELKSDLYRLFARAKKENASQMNDEKVDETIRYALIQFSKIGWITLEEDTFDLHPSFHRLNKIYADYINDIDNIIRQISA
ncbi:hypothetical protein GFS24_17640 [Chitinophaga sp. SYP-B3965]|uniref:condensin complex protein MksE n=1 Tax=Chitinophaga sp. SYP-B3965 TaxID=2663120 RepID=UPI001299FEFA|nr:hypothetical protein [Chitinophaga sp. SYP-B3965]MRG46949.1 hypothetical protein [Chitinophaga sp. SYP-B3965]